MLQDVVQLGDNRPRERINSAVRSERLAVIVRIFRWVELFETSLMERSPVTDMTNLRSLVEKSADAHFLRENEDMTTTKIPALTQIEVPVPMHERIYLQIVHGLMTGHFHPGQKLTYQKVAEELGASQAPVRSAFQRLQALRALEVLPNGSVEVTLLTVESFSSLMQARITVEGAATELAATRMNGNHLRTVRHHCNERTLAAKAADIDRYLQANYDYKFAIYRHCGSEHILFLIETLWLQAGPFLRKLVEGSGLSTSEVLDVAWHHEVAEALEAKDPRRARDAIIQDIFGAATHLLEHAKFRGNGAKPVQA